MRSNSLLNLRQKVQLRCMRLRLRQLADRKPSLRINFNILSSIKHPLTPCSLVRSYNITLPHNATIKKAQSKIGSAIRQLAEKQPDSN